MSDVGGVGTPREVCVRHLRYVCTHHAHTRFRRSQTISKVCVGYFSSVWVCRHTAQIKTLDWERSGTDCRIRLFFSIRGQRVNLRPSVTVALEIEIFIMGRSGTDCRFRLFFSIRGQRVNPRPSVTIALGIEIFIMAEEP